MPSGLNAGQVFHFLRIGNMGKSHEGKLTILKNAVFNMTPRTAPASCALGDVYVDSTGTKLKICTTAGTPGTWTSVGAQT